LTYLEIAHAEGANIFTLCKAVQIKPGQSDAKWDVAFEHSGAGNESNLRTVSADMVFCGAGTLGSTELLLRSAEAGLNVSPKLGHAFSGNGDVIAFGYNNDVEINGIGVGDEADRSPSPIGPVIAGLIDLRRDRPLNENIVIQEGVLPSLLAPLMPAVFSATSQIFGSDTDSGDFLSESARTLESLARGSYRGAVHNTQTYLVMAHDDGDGSMHLSDGKLKLNWPDAGKKAVFDRIDTSLKIATKATGGTYIPNPMWSDLLGENLISVHPLGGCAMGENSDSGVVDHRCRVFDGNGGLHEGLYVMDGAVIPRSLGVNPALTITALAERAMELLLD